jgi:hypothetical protein
MNISFFDLGYIIETNQQRLEQYNTNLQKVTERLTNIILVYSALGIFSLVYFIRLLLPVEIAYLDPPSKYYRDFLAEMQERFPGDDKKVDNSLKVSYVLELENAIAINFNVFRKKSSFYYNAFVFALLAVIPYISCVAFHLSKKEDIVQKVQLVSPKKS